MSFQGFKCFVENQPQWDAEATYADVEPKLLADPEVRRELQQNSQVSRAAIRRVIGTDYGLVYISSVFNRKHGDVMKAATANADREKAAKGAIPADPFCYHVTTRRRLKQILSIGLQPNMPAQFSNYQGYSQGKVFLCEKGGVSFWKDKVEDHEEHNSDRPSPAVVLRIPKESVKNMQPDQLGTIDSSSQSWFTTQGISKQHINLIR